MTQRRSALIGANARRADGHAAAYVHVRGARLVAVSARTPGAAETFAGRWAIPHAFTDHRTMLERIAPDFVHISVPPRERRAILEDCDVAGVSGVVLEKPVGLDTDDLVWLEQFAVRSSMRIAVNHQLHFHRSRRKIARLVHEGTIGTVRLIEGSARHLLGYQGTHILEGILDIAANPVDWVSASVWGSAGLEDTGGHHSPDNIAAVLGLGTTVATFRCGWDVAEPVPDVRAVERHHHKRLRVIGDHGSAEWTMWASRLSVDGDDMVERLDYDSEDSLAQACLVDALCGWMDGGKPMAVSLEKSLHQFRVVLGLYRSALEQRAVRTSDVSPTNLLPVLRTL